MTPPDRTYRVLAYRLSGDAPVVSDFTVPAMEDQGLGDSGRGKRYLGTEMTFTPDRPCAADATLTWAWAGVSRAEHARRTMRIDQRAVLTDLPLGRNTLRLSATLSSSTPCAGTLELIKSGIRNTDHRWKGEFPDFKHVDVTE